MQRSASFTSALIAATLSAFAAGDARAQSACEVATSRVSLASLTGARIDSLRIDAAPPHRPRRLGRALGALLPKLHTRTRDATIRRELLLAPGDTVDTLAVAESMRRLRATGYLDDVSIEGRRCAGDGVALTVHTRDRWSEGATMHVRGRSTGVVLHEESLGGTGRAIRLGAQVDRSGLAATAALRDPALLDGRLAGQLALARYGNGLQWSAGIQTRRRSLLETWLGALQATTSEREPASRAGSVFQRTSVSLAFGRRITPTSAPSMLALLVGAETDRADLSAASGTALVGPATVTRSYAGLTAGLLLRATTFDTVGWVLPSETVIDIPRGFEGDVSVGRGRDMRSDRAASHVDGWLGRIWQPTTGTLALTDAWSSGFENGELLHASTVRGSLALLHRANGGLWIARLGGERLIQPDPDVRALATADPTATLLPPTTRLAESAIAGSVERLVHLRPLGSSLMLDGAVFGAGSVRSDPAIASVIDPLPGAESVRIATLGLGLRVSPSRHAGATMRLDVGLPVAASAGLPRRPYVRLTYSPWIFGERHRDGRLVP